MRQDKNPRCLFDENNLKFKLTGLRKFLPKHGWFRNTAVYQTNYQLEVSRLNPVGHCEKFYQKAMRLGPVLTDFPSSTEMKHLLLCFIFLFRSDKLSRILFAHVIFAKTYLQQVIRSLKRNKELPVLERKKERRQREHPYCFKSPRYQLGEHLISKKRNSNGGESEVPLG